MTKRKYDEVLVKNLSSGRLYMLKIRERSEWLVSPRAGLSSRWILVGWTSVVMQPQEV